jgi:nucleoside-diphosphate-sugar epimerase
MESLRTTFTTSAGDFDGPVLVTGAGGCIGSWVLAILTRAGVPVVAFDLRADRRRPALLLDEAALGEVTWTVGDIADTDRVKAVARDHGIRAIVHLAALQVPFCKADPVAGAQANVVGTVNVLEAARERGIRRLAYASSIAAHGVDESKGWLATLYGAYKHCNEQTARVYQQDWGVPSVGLRPGVVYGVGRDQGLTSKTTVAVLAGAAGEAYTVPFRGATSWLYAGEVASAFVHAVSRERDEARVFDCNGVASTVEAGLEQLGRLVPGARLDAGGEPLPFPADLSDEPLRRYLGDYGSISIEDGIAETLGAFRTLLADARVTFTPE